METETVEKSSEVLPAEKLEPKEKETPEEIKKRARKPPAEGPCKMCGQMRMLNRLLLCYHCWVQKNLLDEARRDGTDWLPGDPHPSHCGCNLPEHGGARRGDN